MNKNKNIINNYSIGQVTKQTAALNFQHQISMTQPIQQIKKVNLLPIGEKFSIKLPNKHIQDNPIYLFQRYKKIKYNKEIQSKQQIKLNNQSIIENSISKDNQDDNNHNKIGKRKQSNQFMKGQNLSKSQYISTDIQQAQQYSPNKFKGNYQLKNLSFQVQRGNFRQLMPLKQYFQSLVNSQDTSLNKSNITQKNRSESCHLTKHTHQSASKKLSLHYNETYQDQLIQQINLSIQSISPQKRSNIKEEIKQQEMEGIQDQQPIQIPEFPNIFPHQRTYQHSQICMKNSYNSTRRTVYKENPFRKKTQKIQQKTLFYQSQDEINGRKTEIKERNLYFSFIDEKKSDKKDI